MELSPEDQKKIRARALEFLKDHRTMVVSSISDSGNLHAATVYFVVDDNFHLYFMTLSGSSKCENLRANGKVAFVVGTGPEVITIQGGGIAEYMEEKRGKVFYELIKRAALTTPWQWPILFLAKHGFCTFHIIPTWMVWLNLHKEKYPDIAREEFYQIV